MIKFLKKFKDKILIALACLFIGIGTILSNTLETKAYVTNDFTSSCITYVYNNRTWYYNSNIDSNSDYYLLVNYTISNTSFYNPIYFQSINISTNAISNIITFDYYNSSFQYNTFIQKLPYERLTTNYAWGFSSPYGYTFNVVNIDIVPQDEIYIESYVSNLQNAYDTLQSEYSSYQNTHAYTNEQYNNLMSQNVTLTQQVQSLQSQYDTYVSLHSYTNEQYETLLTNYNTLQNMYNSLQNSYLQLQQEYNRLTIDLAPFNSSIWGNRQATLNGVSIDVSSSSNLNSVVWFRDSYLQIDQREFENFSSYIEGENSFHLVTTSDSIITINSYTAIANFSATLDYGFSIEFYLNNTLVNTTTFFDGSMTTDDGGTTNTFNYNAPITFNKMIIDIVGGPGPTSWTESSYFKANPGTWQMGYDYAVEQLQPRIDILEDSLEEAINKQQVRYAEGYNEGFESRIILNLCMV